MNNFEHNLQNEHHAEFNGSGYLSKQRKLFTEIINYMRSRAIFPKADIQFDLFFMLAIKRNAGHFHVSHNFQTQNSALIGAVGPVLGADPRALQRPHSVFSSEFTADSREKKYDSIVTLG